MFVLAPLYLMGQCDLPPKAIGVPKIFLNEEMSWTWDDVVRNRDWGAFSNNYWKVYIDREGVSSYVSPKSSSRVKEKSLKFMESYYVAELKDSFALLYKEKYEQTGLLISRDAKSIGWVAVDKLLLWSTCPRTRGQVYQKAIIAKNVDEIQNKTDLNEVSPVFSKSPIKIDSTGYRATDLEIYFVYKYVDKNALLFKVSKFSQNMAPDKHGWMRSGLYVRWNERLCYEPNFGSNLVGKVAAVYETPDQALQYKQGMTPSGKVWDEKLTNNRWKPSKVRFPVLDIDGNYIANVATIGYLSGKSNVDSPKLDDINDKIQTLEKKMRRVNVVFVMDGTSSMSNYYKPMAMALVNSMTRVEIKGADIRFGALVYRNYADVSRLCEFKQLTSQHQDVAEWLIKKGDDCKSVGSGHSEAMFYGLNCAIDTMSWKKEEANFLILVGDAANDNNDTRYNAKAIAQKMAGKEINFVAFQAHHTDRDEYHDFTTQILEIMSYELSFVMNREVSIKNDFKNSEQSFTFKTNNGHIPIMTAAYRYAQIYSAEEDSDLQYLVENRIVEFKSQSDSSLAEFRKGLNNIGAVGVSYNESNIRRILKAAGLTDADIEIYKNKNLALKIKGYTSRVADQTEAFTTSVFLTKKELDELIASLKKVTRNVTTNPRQDLQNALKDLALSYLGKIDETRDYITVDDVMTAVSTLTPKTGKNVLQGVNVKDITNPNKVTDAEINDFISSVSRDIGILEKRKEDKTCYYERDGLRYYYILLEDMPLQEHN